MSHYAYVKDGQVLDVIVAEQEFIDHITENNQNRNDPGGSWIQTSYNTRNGVHLGSDGEPDGGVALRYNFAAIGGQYLSDLDAFVPAKPFNNWTFDSTTMSWQAPVPYPTDGQQYEWNESTQAWQQWDYIFK